MRRRVSKFTIWVFGLIMTILVSACGSSHAIGKGDPKHNTKTKINPTEMKKEPVRNKWKTKNKPEPKTKSKLEPSKSKSKPVPSEIKYQKNPHKLLGNKKQKQKTKKFKRDTRGYHKTLGQRK